MKRYKSKFAESIEINYVASIAAIEHAYKILKDKEKELENIKKKKEHTKETDSNFEHLLKQQMGCEEEIEKTFSSLALTPDIRKYIK